MEAWPIIALVAACGFAAILWLGWSDGWIGNRADWGRPRRRALRHADFVGIAEVARFSAMRKRMGYHAANRIMQALAERARGEGVQIGRVGRDAIEFTFRAESAAAARDAMAALKAGLEESLSIDSILFEPELVIGCNPVSTGIHHEELFDVAACAVEDARKAPDRISFAEDQAHAAASLKSASMVQDLYSAIRQDGLELHYMPKLGLTDHGIHGVEALCRWTHAEHGMIPPMTFVQLAEETGMIGDLTLWTLDRSIADQKRLIDATGIALMFDVNISALLLGNHDFCTQLIERAAGAAFKMGIEITETAVIDDPQSAFRNLERIDAAGIHIAIDDFGAGLSSLAYLRDLPAHELKIDQAFVRSLTTSNRDPLLVRSAIDIAHALEMTITAEGVEDELAMALLRVMRCDHAQGFHISRPLPFDKLTAFLTDRARLGALAEEGSAARTFRLRQARAG